MPEYLSGHERLMSESTRSLDQTAAYDAGSESDTESYKSTDGPLFVVDKAAAPAPPGGYAPRYDHPPPPPCHAAEGIYGPATDAHQRPACAQCAFHLRTIDGLQRELRRCRAELTKLHYIVAPNDLPPLEHGRPVMMSRPCRKFRRLDAPVLSPISRVDENNGTIRRRRRRGKRAVDATHVRSVAGYGDDAALELALQASLEDAARAKPQRQPAPPPGPQLHPFG